jgi:hypothetical protein
LLRYAVSSTATGAAVDDWTLVTIDTGDGIPIYTSLALVGTGPAVAYNDLLDGTLEFAMSSSSSGDQPEHWSFETADPVATSGEYASLAALGGRPMIVHCENFFDGGQLKFTMYHGPQ